MTTRFWRCFVVENGSRQKEGMSDVVCGWGFVMEGVCWLNHGGCVEGDGVQMKKCFGFTVDETLTWRKLMWFGVKMKNV